MRRAIYLVVLNANDPSPLCRKPATSQNHQARMLRTKARSKCETGGAHRCQRHQSTSARSEHSGRRLQQSQRRRSGNVLLHRTDSPAARREHFACNVINCRERAAAPFLEGSIRSYSISADKKKLLYQAGDGANRWGVVATERPAKVGDGPLNVAQLEMRVDPRAEWAQIYRETWRIQREYFYDAKMHGADWQAIYEKYKPLLAFVGHRADLGYLIAMMGGELTVGHSYLHGYRRCSE